LERYHSDNSLAALQISKPDRLIEFIMFRRGLFVKALKAKLAHFSADSSREQKVSKLVICTSLEIDPDTIIGNPAVCASTATTGNPS
jgi:hypothetical protein